METESSPSWFEKIQRTVRNILQTVNPFQTPVDISGKSGSLLECKDITELFLTFFLFVCYVEAENIQKEYDEANTKLSTLKSKISRLTKKLGNNFGIFFFNLRSDNNRSLSILLL